jgi:hypothetical protein
MFLSQSAFPDDHLRITESHNNAVTPPPPPSDFFSSRGRRRVHEDIPVIRMEARDHLAVSSVPVIAVIGCSHL